MVKNKPPKKLSAKPKLLWQKLICAAVMVCVALMLHYGLTREREKALHRQVPQAQIEITIEEVPAEPDFETQALIRTAAEAEKFLYESDNTVHVIVPETAKPELLESVQPSPDLLPVSQASADVASTDKIAALIEREISFELPSLSEKELSAGLENCNQDILDKIYEEELPDNIIDENADNEFTHINHTKIKNLNIIPLKKPPYFGEEPVIAIVIDDMGVSQRQTKDITSLKAPLTASFLTYSSNLASQIENARQAGHEIMIHVPMEAQKQADAAPDVLTTQMTPDELRRNFSAMLEKFHGIKGINNHMGSKLTEDEPRMEVIMDVLKQHNLFFLDSKTSAKSKAEIAAKNRRVAYGHRHVFLDNNNDKTYILGQLALTERLARKNGYAIAIGHPKSQTYEALKDWLQTLDKKQIRLLHLSEIIAVLNPGSEIAALK